MQIVPSTLLLYLREKNRDTKFCRFFSRAIISVLLYNVIILYNFDIGWAKVRIEEEATITVLQRLFIIKRFYLLLLRTYGTWTGETGADKQIA